MKLSNASIFMKKPSKNPKVIIILGPPGSGKGTQAKLLAKEFSLEYVGIGDILRKRRKIEDFTGHNFSVPKSQLAIPKIFFEDRSRQLIHWIFSVGAIR